MHIVRFHKNEKVAVLKDMKGGRVGNEVMEGILIRIELSGRNDICGIKLLAVCRI